MIYVNRTKYDRTKSVTFPKYRHLRLRPHASYGTATRADAVASELAAGKGGVGLQSVAEKMPRRRQISMSRTATEIPARLRSFPRGKIRLLICAAARCLRSLMMSATSTETGSEAWTPF